MGHNAFRKRANPETAAYAREHRANPTAAENKLWQELRRTGYRWRRQAVVLGYIADFWLPSRQLVVELDGKHHYSDPQTRQNDAHRDAAMNDKGIHVVRITNRLALIGPTLMTRDLAEVADSLARARTPRTTVHWS